MFYTLLISLSLAILGKFYFSTNSDLASATEESADNIRSDGFNCAARSHQDGRE